MSIAENIEAAPRAQDPASLRQPALLDAALLLVAIAILVWAFANGIPGDADLSLTVHSLLEALYVAGAIAIFSVAWYAPGGVYRLRATLVACLFVPVAVFDLLHFLSYPGMPGPLAAHGAQASFYFSRVARFALPFALLALALAPHAAAISGRTRLVLLGAMLAAMAPFAIYGFGPAFAATGLPDTPSAFITLSRAANIALFLLAAFVAGRLGDMDRPDARYQIFAALLCATTEGCLILGQGVGIINLFSILGHVYGILALAATFVAVYGEAVRHPYAELAQTHAATRLAGERHAAILAAIGDGVVGIDDRLRILFANPVACRLVGMPASGAEGMPLADALAPPGTDAAACVADVETCLRDGKTRAGTRYAPKAEGNDEPRAIEYAATPVRDGDERIVGAVLVLRDITARWQLEQQLLAAAGYARDLFEASPDPLIAIAPDGIVADANRAAELMSGMERRQLVGARFVARFTDTARAREALRRALGGETLRDRHLELARAGGGVLQVSCSIAPQRDANGICGAFAVVRDITDLHQARLQLQFQADYDALTALPNRRLFRERIAQAIARADRDGHPVAVMVVDLDDFKDINDTLGASQGDELLKLVALRLAATLRETDTLARLGGDEFGVLASGAALAREIQPLTERILAAVAEPLSLGGRELTVACSIGVSLHPLDAGDADGLLANADTAMHRAKENGKNGYQYFKPEMNEALRRRVGLAHRLRGALARGEFALHYQPQVDLQDGAVVGVEALLRWNNPELGFVSPAEFIPVAEDTGLILPIGAWVLDEACRQAARWHDASGGELAVAVNLSARQFRDPGLVDMVGKALDDAGLPARLLELELTESMLMRDAAGAATTMERLKATGASLAIDDFGTGYSSLAYLKRFPLDKLKIDRSFVMDIPDDANDAAIVRSIVGLAHGLGLKIVAEGAETAAQMDFLRAHGCETVQGYFVSRPLPAADLPAFVARWNAEQDAGQPLRAASGLTASLPAGRQTETETAA